MKELKLKKCMKCNALVKVLEDCKDESCGIVCCGEPMKEVKANSTDAAFEKHVPTYEVKDGKIFVKVNHVMEEEHYIEWIYIETKKGFQVKYLEPNQESSCSISIIDNEIEGVYSYCNLHGLWKKEVE